jgi:kynurenine formamidase
MKKSVSILAVLLIVCCASLAFAQELKIGAIVDLSHLVEQNMPVDPSLKLPTLEFFGKITDGGLHNLEVISYCPHTGTHMDAPYHVMQDAPATESWPADVLIGPAVIITVGKPGGYEITKQDIQNWESKYGAIKPGEAVLFHTGHDANWSKGYDEYIGKGYPYMTVEAAKYLADKKIRYVAVESISPDTDTTEAHKIFLNNGIPVIENVCNLGEIPQTRCTTIGTFPAVKGATGVWVRLLAVL